MNAPQGFGRIICKYPPCSTTTPVPARRTCCGDAGGAEGPVTGWLADVAASCFTSCILSLPVHEQTGGGGQHSKGLAAAQTPLLWDLLQSTWLLLMLKCINTSQQLSGDSQALRCTKTTRCTHLLVNMEPSILTLCPTKVGTGIMEAFVRLT